MKNAAKCDTSCELHELVSHQNFERNLHFRQEVCLLECLFIPTPEPRARAAPAASFHDELVRNRAQMKDPADSHRLNREPNLARVARGANFSAAPGRRDVQPIPAISSTSRVSVPAARFSPRFAHSSDRTSNQTRLPAEFKHINKRRKRN